jgi:hypothetical protein
MSDDTSDLGIGLFLFGWVSSLLAIGYYSTPSDSIFGKIAFSFVVVMVAGILFKMLHLMGANIMIIIGLAGIVAVYALMWFREKKTSSDK